jgi:hypothetical protein
MIHHLQRAIAAVLVALACVACGPAASTATPSPSPMTFDAYSAAFCSAWASLFQAVGNPDTGSGSDLSHSLDDAVAAGDVATSERLAATVTTKLELARQQAAEAARWPSAATMLAQFDRVVLAYEAMIAAKRGVAAQTPGANPQAAFEQAGGLEAWTAMFQTYPAVARPSGGSTANCPNLPIAP